jgi:sialidase-1
VRDNGLTWNKPREITSSVKKPAWRWYATGPGPGIQLTHSPHSGRLIIPANHSDHSDPNRHPYRSHVVYSEDHGETWQIGGVLDERTNESTIIELSDGTLVDNMRSYHGRNRRAISRSSDGGMTWSKVVLDDTLIEPVCQASMIRTGSRILFANPASTRRECLTVRESENEVSRGSESKFCTPVRRLIPRLQCSRTVKSLAFSKPEIRALTRSSFSSGSSWKTNYLR